MNLEPIIPSDVSHPNKCIWNLEKRVLKNFFMWQQWRNRHRKQTYGYEEKEGEGEIYGESNMETYITICKIDSQREFAVWLRKQTGALYQPRGVRWGGRWEAGSKGRGYMYTYG